MRMLKRPLMFLLCAVPALVCMAVIFRFSAQPAAVSSDTSGGLIRQILTVVMPEFPELSPEEQEARIESLQTVVRKGAHFTVYALLGILCVPPVFVLCRRLRPSLFRAFGVTVLYAASDELHQYFVPGRSCELTDVLIDAGGAALGLLLLGCTVFLINRKKAK